MQVLMVDSLVGNDYSLALCSSLAAQEVDVRLVVTRDRNIEFDIPFPVTYLAPSKSLNINKIKKVFQYLNYLFQLVIHIYRSNIQVVHFQFLRHKRLDILSLCALRMLSVPTVYTAHNVLPHENNKIDYLLRYLVYRVVDGIIVHSEYIQKKLLRTFKLAEEKTIVIPHGNFDLYLPENELTTEEARNQLRLKNEDMVLLFFGYIRPYKGLDLLIDAFETASFNDRSLKLVIAGAPQSKQLAEKYEMQIQDSAASERILFQPHFIPFDEVAIYFTAADVVVLPYKTIDHSGIVHLAYSFGKPVVGTPVGDFAEVIEQGLSGYLLENCDEECLVNTIKIMSDDKPHLKRMGHLAKELSETKYSWETIARETKQFYKTIIAREKRLVPDM